MKAASAYRRLAGLLRLGIDPAVALRRLGWTARTVEEVESGGALTMILPPGLRQAAAGCDDFPAVLESLADCLTQQSRRHADLRLLLSYPVLVLGCWLALAAFLGQYMLLAIVLICAAALLSRLPSGPWLRLEEQASFLRWLRLLLSLGQPLPEAAEQAAGLTSAVAWKRELRRVCAALARGDSLSQALLDDPLVGLLRNAETRGLPASDLQALSDLLQQRARAVFRRSQELLEPGLMIALGGLVALLWWTFYAGQELV